MKHPGIRGHTFSDHCAKVFSYLAILMLCVATIICRAQTASKTTHHRVTHQGEKKTSKPAPPSHSAAQPAEVKLHDGKLTIHADNSDLNQILLDVAEISGMTIHGLEKSSRIFGIYGPGRPSDVLSKLLDGSDYNFIIAGSMEDGAPGELLLMAKRSSSEPAIAKPAPSSPIPPPSESTDDTPPPEVEIAQPALDAPSVENNQDSQDTDQDAHDRLEQTLQRLQHMNDQQEQNPPN